MSALAWLACGALLAVAAAEVEAEVVFLSPFLSLSRDGLGWDKLEPERNGMERNKCVSFSFVWSMLTRLRFARFFFCFRCVFFFFSLCVVALWQIQQIW